MQEKGFAWEDSERGHFREDFFPPVDIPVILHTPWVQRNIPIPPGLYDEVCRVIKTKIDAGVYEPSNSSYRSRWFCIVKKDGKSLCLVHSLEPLNKVTIQHSGALPFTDQLAEGFAGCACGAVLDLYVGYDERALAPISRDLTTFQTPYGAKRLTTLPMGWSNSVPIFHEDVVHILQPEIPHVTDPYIDDVGVKGPKTTYPTADGSPEVLPENPGIRRFVFEHFENVNRVVQRMKYCGGTFSGAKSFLCVEEFTIVGHHCMPQGRLPDEDRVAKIVAWGPCSSLTEVRAFLGTVGVARMFIQNFAKCAHALTILMKKDTPFEFGPAQVAAQEDLKSALLNSPALQSIDYHSSSPVIVAVDTSPIAVGFYLVQANPDEPKKRYFARFSSITLNEQECRFSQPKLELYGLFRALRALKVYIIGVRNLVVEVDCCSIKGMLDNPDLTPNASMNRWIIAIRMFHFELVHVPGILHGPDGLSRRPSQLDDAPDEEDGEEFEDWINQVYGFVQHINPHPTVYLPLSSTSLSTLVQSEIVEPTVPSNRIILEEATYEDVPRSDDAIAEDVRVNAMRLWLASRERPPDLDDKQLQSFVRYTASFFLHNGVLWHRSEHGAHQRVLDADRRWDALVAAHDQSHHKGFYATRALLQERVWWPHLANDLSWFIKSCHLCQTRQTRNILIPPVVAVPAPLFAKMYIDTMHMPPSGGFKYIVQGRCSVSHYPEACMLRQESAHTLGDWLYEDVLCQWGTLVEIVSDNGSAFVKALAYLERKFHVKHIHISGYNSRANGIVECSHFDLQQALFKAVDGDQT